MATNATRTQQATVNAVVQAAMGKEAGARRVDSGAGSAGDAPRRPSGYGLPCSKCHLYYPADLDVCPTCKHNERVSPVLPKIPARVAQDEPDPVPIPPSSSRSARNFFVNSSRNFWKRTPKW